MVFNPTPQQIADEIGAAMLRHKPRVTLEQLSRSTGMSVATLSRRLNGGSSIKWSELTAICDALDVTVDSIIEDARRKAGNREANVVPLAG